MVVLLHLHPARHVVVVHARAVLEVELVGAVAVVQRAPVVLAAPVARALLRVVVVGLVAVGLVTDVTLREVCRGREGGSRTERERDRETECGGLLGRVYFVVLFIYHYYYNIYFFF